MTELLWMSENVSCPGAEWNCVEFGILLLILCWNGLFSVFANFRGEISLFLISKVFSLLDAVIIFSKSSGDIYQNLLEIRAPLIYLTLPWYSNFIHPCKATKKTYVSRFFNTQSCHWHQLSLVGNFLDAYDWEMFPFFDRCPGYFVFSYWSLLCISLASAIWDWKLLRGRGSLENGGKNLVLSSVQYRRNPFCWRIEEEKRLLKT